MCRGQWKAIGGALVICAVLLGATSAEALPITGGVRFGGGIGPVDDWQTVNEIDIMNDLAIVVCNPAVPCTGVFAGLDNGVAEYHDFSFDPVGGNITPLWSFNGFSFHLMGITAITRGTNGIVLRGFGTMFGTGYDPTPSAWSFSADETAQVFAFSSTTSALPVPDSGSTLMLLGAGLFALAFVQSRFGLN
jgi:hypothetical protein